MRIAVIGAGISGAGAAWALSSRHDVVVYESETRLGGHSHTVDIDYDGATIAVDTGFIVFNELNYPNLTALFAELGVTTKASDMSFGLSLDGGDFEWSGKTIASLFAQRSNMIAPSYLWMLREILRFNKLCRADLASGALAGATLGGWLDRHRLSRRFRDDYLMPMAAAIWSMPAADVLGFPAESFVTFFDNHKLIDLDRPVWRTVDGGSRTYVEKLAKSYQKGLRQGVKVVSVLRDSEGVTVIDDAGARERFDQVVFACHSDQALEMLSDPGEDEYAVLSSIRYRANDVVLHRDPTLMPKRTGVWSAWNYLGSRKDPDSANRDVAVTYWMNALQGIDPARPLFITLNPPFEPDASRIFRRFSYSHPQYDAEALAAQRRISSVQGRRQTWFCGAWTGNGFHEDGLSSGLAVAERLGGVIPWRARPPLMEAAQ